MDYLTDIVLFMNKDLKNAIIVIVACYALFSMGRFIFEFSNHEIVNKQGIVMGYRTSVLSAIPYAIGFLALIFALAAGAGVLLNTTSNELAKAQDEYKQDLHELIWSQSGTDVKQVKKMNSYLKNGEYDKLTDFSWN